MVVQHNMQAMNANRMLNVTTSTQAKQHAGDERQQNAQRYNIYTG